jgi:signal transduction histidine kinase
MVHEKAISHNLMIKTHVGENGEIIVINADRLRIKQVLLNLLSNSVKFTPDGGEIAIVATRNSNEIRICVADNGIGIDPKDQEGIFEVFFQVQSRLTDKTQGTGLGLALCRRFVEMHGGKIWFESKGKNKGTRFTFTIPLNQNTNSLNVHEQIQAGMR